MESFNGIVLQMEIQTFPVPSQVLHREGTPGAHRDLQVGSSSTRAGANSQLQMDFLTPENAAEMTEICIFCPHTIFECEKNF